ncbi:MAG: hypothetical protein QME46_00935 [Thermoanaerobacteraceae bacterium]|nr:hypothetical protein [Thermoanaerobacteraceae bacterium]
MKKRILVVAGAVLSLFLVIGVAFADTNPVPGSKEDPVVTKSYVDQALGQIKGYVDDMLSRAGQGGGTELEVVNLNPGEKIILEAGAEIILRAGEATIYSPTPNGLSDVTGGKDLVSGTPIPSNHLLIAPRSDGRGVVAKTAAVFMVRGQYSK